MRNLPLFAALGCAFLLAGCPAPDDGPEPPHLLYSADTASLDNPFPDLRLVDDNGFQARADWYKAYLPKTAVKALTVSVLKTWSQRAVASKGFGSLGLTLINTSEPVDRSTLAGSAVRLRKTADGYEILEENVAVEHARDSIDSSSKTPDENYPGYLLVRPSVILPEGDAGLLVIKKGIKTASGAELGRGFDFKNEPASKERITQAAKALGISEDDVLLALPLKAENVTAPMKALAGFTTAMASPEFVIPAKGSADNGPVGTWLSTDADWSTIKDELETHGFARPAQYVKKVVIGRFKAHDLRENGVWKPEYLSNPASSPKVDLYFTMTLPGGAKPAGGWPTVIGGHGLNGANSIINGDLAGSFCMEVAELLAKAGIACIGIDAASHGRRGSSLDFFAFDDLTKARDNFRQTAFDMMQLSRLLQSLDIDGDAQPDVSADFGYFGNSLGGIMGANFLSFDPRVKFGLLNVPGGGLSNILTSPVIRDQVGLLLVTKTNLVYETSDYYAAIPIFRALGQLILEQADPIHHGQAMDNKPLLIQMGVDDLTIPNLTTVDLARTVRTPELTSNQTNASGIRGMFRMDPKKYIPSRAAGYNGHNIFWESAAAPVRIQAVKFIQTQGTEFVVE